MSAIFAELLSESKARPGHNFVSMTAQEALQMDHDKFVEKLETLSGTSSVSGPPPSVDRINARVDYQGSGMRSDAAKHSHQQEWVLLSVIYSHPKHNTTLRSSTVV